MDKATRRAARHRYDREVRMGVKSSSLKHPLDTELRTRLRSLKEKQNELAQRIGRRPAWMNKFIHGAGHATIDDWIRIAAVLSGVDPPRLTDDERQLLRRWRRLPDDDARQDALLVLASVARRRRGSSARAERKSRPANHKGPGRP
jgi:hypothetical protein